MADPTVLIRLDLLIALVALATVLLAIVVLAVVPFVVGLVVLVVLGLLFGLAWRGYVRGLRDRTATPE
ncbi:hypothetical protein ACFQH6_14560 [Halobacteriaceae archaeon GCM10025711]